MALSSYDMQRQRIRQDSATASQEQNDALKRRFARMGGLNSGSYNKASERLAGQQEQNQQRALEGVDIQEAQTAENRAEADRNRTFAREERLGSQGFASGESALGRRFAAEEAEKGRGFTTSERLGAQGFASGEAERGRQFASREADVGRQFAREESALGRAAAAHEGYWNREVQQKAQQDALKQQQHQFYYQNELAQKQFDLDKETTDFNKNIARIQVGGSWEEMKAELLRQFGSQLGGQRNQAAYNPSNPDVQGGPG